jgi:hypothetical protein
MPSIDGGEKNRCFFGGWRLVLQFQGCMNGDERKREVEKRRGQYEWRVGGRAVYAAECINDN